MKVTNTLASLRKGFTVMETLLAIGIISMLLGIFLTLFVPAKDMVRSAMAREESERITSVLRSEMTRIRANERAGKSATASTNTMFVSGFDKGFRWIQRSVRPASAIVIFSYRADTSKTPREDGSFPAVIAGKHTPSVTNDLVTMACPLSEALHNDDIKNAVGPVFLVRMTELQEQANGDFLLAKRPGVIANVGSPEDYLSSKGEENVWGGVIFFRADFFLLSPPDPARYKRTSWDSMGKPVFSANLSIRR